MAGNVRELMNAVERSAVLARSDEVRPEDLLLEPLRPVPPRPEAATLQEWLERAAAERIRVALVGADGRKAEAATALGIDRTTLFRWMKRLGL